MEVTEQDSPAYCIFCECGDAIVWQKDYVQFYCIGCDKAWGLYEISKVEPVEENNGRT